MRRLLKMAMLMLCCAICLFFGNTRADGQSDADSSARNDDSIASFLWITDLQSCSFHKGEYASVAEWCAGLAKEKDISLLMGTGDYVGKWYSEQQWKEFRSFLDIMNGTVPAIYIAGNHDYRLRTKDFSMFLKPVYGNNDCSAKEYYQNGRGRYVIVKDGGLNWLIIGMSYSYGESEREWINSVLEQYPDYPAILLFHDYLKASGKLTAPGEWIYEEVIKTHKNVRLVLCGHNHGACVRTDWPEGPDGRFVQSVMYNFQERKARRGSVQLLRIDVSDQTVELLCQSPIKTKVRPLTKVFKLDLRGLAAG